MKLTKDILDKAMINAGIPSEKAAVLYNWEEPADFTSSEYSSAINNDNPHILSFAITQDN